MSGSEQEISRGMLRNRKIPFSPMAWMAVARRERFREADRIRLSPPGHAAYNPASSPAVDRRVQAEMEAAPIWALAGGEGSGVEQRPARRV